MEYEKEQMKEQLSKAFDTIVDALANSVCQCNKPKTLRDLKLEQAMRKGLFTKNDIKSFEGN